MLACYLVNSILADDIIKNIHNKQISCYFEVKRKQLFPILYLSTYL